MKNGAAVSKQLRNGSAGGSPWMTILDGEGTELITGTDPDGQNIGCPVTESECGHFMTMLNETKQRISDEQIQSFADALDEYALQYRRR